MRQVVRPLLPVWLGLLALFAVELGTAFLPLGHAFAGLILLPAAAMVGLVGFGFMRLGRYGAIARCFALAAVFWLLVLLGLGSMDPFTRTEYPVRVTTYP
ncbi:MAG: hypothetical protein JO209_06475 [Acidisphaera sp.]|nr:hypothetical protein [Acidisphaera sp.]